MLFLLLFLICLHHTYCCLLFNERVAPVKPVWFDHLPCSNSNSGSDIYPQVWLLGGCFSKPDCLFSECFIPNDLPEKQFSSVYLFFTETKVSLFSNQ